MYNRHKRAAGALNNDDNNQRNLEQTKEQSRHKVITRQSLASIGKKSRHQRDTTTSTLNKDNTNKSTTTTKDCLNTVPNSNVMHMNDSVTTNK